MRSLLKVPAVLVLEDGTRFDGYSIGKIGTTTGEICFNTGTTGYQEVFTDPSYFGQILIETNAHIGNYGVKDTEAESRSVQIAGLVCRNFNEKFSRMQATDSLQDFLVAGSIVGISDVDTRELVQHIRNKGAMNAIISSELTDITELQARLAATPGMAGMELSSMVSTPLAYDFGPQGAEKRVAIVDYGIKQNTLRSLASREVLVRVFPAKTEVEEMVAWGANGFLLSNGPGDPAAMEYAVDATRQMLGSGLPVFGICLGHQVLCRTAGLHTYKMHHGHRGINHPVINLETGRCEITSQNHGFGVDETNAAAQGVKVTHRNLNDNTLEGIRLLGQKAFSVQYHPEAAPGPHDSRYLFDEFVALL